MEGEPQAGGEDLEKRRIEGTKETAKTEKALAQRWVLHKAQAGA
jgi:hypothetical protein